MPSLSTKERKTKLRVPIKELNDEIKVNRGLQAELECKQDLIVQEESEAFEILSDLYHKRLDALYELDLKLRKFEN